MILIYLYILLNNIIVDVWIRNKKTQKNNMYLYCVFYIVIGITKWVIINGPPSIARAYESRYYPLHVCAYLLTYNICRYIDMCVYFSNVFCGLWRWLPNVLPSTCYSHNIQKYEHNMNVIKKYVISSQLWHWKPSMNIENFIVTLCACINSGRNLILNLFRAPLSLYIHTCETQKGFFYYWGRSRFLQK